MPCVAQIKRPLPSVRGNTTNCFTRGANRSSMQGVTSCFSKKTMLRRRRRRAKHVKFQVWNKKFKVAARLAFKAVACVSSAVVAAACEIWDDIASTAAASAEKAEAEARKSSCTQWKAVGRGLLQEDPGRSLWTKETTRMDLGRQHQVTI